MTYRELRDALNKLPEFTSGALGVPFSSDLDREVQVEKYHNGSIAPVIWSWRPVNLWRAENGKLIIVNVGVEKPYGGKRNHPEAERLT